MENKKNLLTGFIKEKIIAIFAEFDGELSKNKVMKICERVFKNISKLEGLTSYYGVSSLNLEQESSIKKLYKEADQALDISVKSNELGKVVLIDELSLELLFNSIPEEVFEKFVNNILSNKIDIENLRGDKVLFETIEQFLLNNLNSSETSRALYIHRNTLNYRLDKIMKITGKDPRILDNAMELRFLIWYLKRTQN